ncbi:hypothetical protein PSTG_17874 [Puccinia striiformis f. sp. tritici PST-78]|uniref:Uncharacterized protein n=1 Tax=Puccinia striiformis f. sp. tritici PST-78 TaxID=1165861 RepID=A0A0L0UNW9_9BASI|nr:hypothetical protein PSTG_17874 [Puccinia striiformis f. sp. tritici PST-78]
MSNDNGEHPSNTAKDPPAHLTVTLEPGSMSSSNQKTSAPRLPVLNPPGPNTNYLDWEMVVEAYFRHVKVKHVLDTSDIKLRKATWSDDNDLICATILQIIDPANNRYVRPFRTDGRGMWIALAEAHQDTSTGGKVYWIRKLLIARMEGDNIDSHIDTMAKYHERLNALVTPEKPLTPDDVHTAALLGSIPKDWVACVSNLMNQEGIKTATIVSALKNESIRRQSQGDIISVSSTATKPPAKSGNPNNPPKKKFCTMCNLDTHDLNSCHNTRRLIEEHKANRKKRYESKDQPAPSGKSSKPPARAGRTSTATLGASSHSNHNDSDTDYSGSEVEVTAGNAVASLSVSFNPKASGDANLDSGCSMSMTPHLHSIDNPKLDRTPVHLADHSVVESTHKGMSRLPKKKKIPQLKLWWFLLYMNRYYPSPLFAPRI